MKKMKGWAQVCLLYQAEFLTFFLIERIISRISCDVSATDSVRIFQRHILSSLDIPIGPSGDSIFIPGIVPWQDLHLIILLILLENRWIVLSCLISILSALGPF